MVGKHEKKDKSKISIIIGICLIVLSLAILMFYILISYRIRNNLNSEIEAETSSKNIENTELINQKEDEIENTQEITNDNEIQSIGNYKVIGKIIISKIELEDVILEKTTDTSLNLGITKFWGPDINKPGNVSITGHNYKIERSKLFSELDKLQKGDTFELEDMDKNRITYKIFDKYTVYPENTDSIDQNYDGKREVTLITCTKGAKKRIIIKAREI